VLSCFAMFTARALPPASRPALSMASSRRGVNMVLHTR
jgi:hypothetical protein